MEAGGEQRTAGQQNSGGSCLRDSPGRQQPHERLVLVLGLEGWGMARRPRQRSSGKAVLSVRAQWCKPKRLAGSLNRPSKAAMLCRRLLQRKTWGSSNRTHPALGRGCAGSCPNARGMPPQSERRPHLQAGAQVGDGSPALQLDVAGHLHAARHGHEMRGEAAPEGGGRGEGEQGRRQLCSPEAASGSGGSGGRRRLGCPPPPPWEPEQRWSTPRSPPS